MVRIIGLFIASLLILVGCKSDSSSGNGSSEAITGDSVSGTATYNISGAFDRTVNQEITVMVNDSEVRIDTGSASGTGARTGNSFSVPVGVSVDGRTNLECNGTQTFSGTLSQTETVIEPEVMEMTEEEMLMTEEMEIIPVQVEVTTNVSGTISGNADCQRFNTRAADVDFSGNFSASGTVIQEQMQ